MLRARGRAAVWIVLMPIALEPPIPLAARGEAPRLPPLTPAVACAELEAHVRTIASDAFGGRSTGAEGERMTTDYLARVMAEQGVAPAGDDGTYLQKVPLWRRVESEAPKLAWIDANGTRHDARRGVDFEVGGDGPTSGELEIVLVRAEADVPRESRADVALFLDQPSLSKRRAWLASAGHPNGEGFGLVLSPLANAPEASRAPREGRVQRERPKADAPARIGLWGDLLASVRSGNVARVRFESHATWQPVDSFNVVGKVVGKGGEDTAQAIVVSAHFDHLGQRPPSAAPKAAVSNPTTPDVAAEDLVFNGADDDASGVAAVLEIAGALAAEPAPARTVVFLLATGEEIGLLGTREYLARPTVPLDRTVANLNFEMIGRPDPLVGGAGILWLTGFERTNLGPAFAEKGLAVRADPRPDEHFYERSDNYAFVQKGIVGQTLSSYNMHKDYHTVDDEVERIDFEHLCACSRSGLEAVRILASEGFRPQWSEKPQATPR